MLIFPNLSAGNIAYKLLNHLGGATAIGPILVGMNRPVHVLERGADVQDIVNMAAVAVVDAQERDRRPDARATRPPRNDTDDLLEAIARWRLQHEPHAGRRTARAQPDARRAGAHTAGRRALEPRRARAARGRDSPRRGRARRHGPVRRRDGAAHRPLAQRQVRRARIRRPRTDVDWGKVNQPFAAGAVRDAAQRRAAVSERARRAVRAGSLLRRRSEVPPRRCATSRRARGTWRSCGTCSSARTSPTSRASIRTSRCSTRRSSRPIRRSLRSSPARSARPPRWSS